MRCVSCWQPLDAGETPRAIGNACPECGFDRAISALVAEVAPETLAREEWHRSVRRALWIAVTALAAAIGLAVAQELERRSGAFGGPALGTPGAMIRLAIDASLVATALVLVRGRAMPRSAIPILFLAATLAMVGAALGVAMTGVRGVILPTNAVLPRLEQAGHALASVLVVVILLRFAWWLRSRMATVAATLAGVALLPLVAVGTLRLVALVWWPDAGLDSPVKAFLRWIDLLRMSEPAIVTLARHAWELPAIVAIAAILQAQRGSRLGAPRAVWAEKLAARHARGVTRGQSASKVRSGNGPGSRGDHS